MQEPRPRRQPSRRPTAHSHDPARDAAFRALEFQCRRFPEVDALEPETDSLQGRDAAFAHAIYAAAIRRLLTLSGLMKPLLSRQPFSGLEPQVKAALLGGAAQIMFMDRVPIHAAIDRSVEWIKSTPSPGAAGLVNAILRRIGELRSQATERLGFEPDDRHRDDVIVRSDGRVFSWPRPIWQGPPIERLSAASSTPVPMLERWAGRFGLDAATDLAFHGLCDPPTVVNVGHAKGPLPDSLVPHSDPRCCVYAGDPSALGAMLTARRDIWVQDSASTQAVLSAATLRPSRVLDLCAGQGTKTQQLAAVFPEAEIVATDQDEARVHRLRQATAHLANVRVIQIEEIDLERAFELVLLDVPCSNTGVLARRVEARYRPMSPQLDRLTAIQRGILARVERILTPSGAILYSTCSLEPEEDEDFISFAAGRGWRSGEPLRTLPAGQPGSSPSEYRDGAFSVVMRR